MRLNIYCHVVKQQTGGNPLNISDLGEGIIAFLVRGIASKGLACAWRLVVDESTCVLTRKELSKLKDLYNI
jgi:hypothetical protein